MKRLTSLEHDEGLALPERLQPTLEPSLTLHAHAQKVTAQSVRGSYCGLALVDL